MKKEIIQTLKIVTLSLIFSASFAFAWTAPTGAPTAGDTTAPINKGASPDPQIKLGGLATGVLTVYGTSNFHGNVNILTDTVSGSSIYNPTPFDSNIIKTATKSFNNIFSSLDKSFKNIITSLNANTAYANFIGAGSGTINPIGCPPFCIGDGDTYPSFSFVYPSDPSDPYENNYYPIGVYNAPGEYWDNTTTDSTPSFKVTSPNGGTITWGGGDRCVTSTTSIPGGNVTTTIQLAHLYNDYYTCTLKLSNSSFTQPTAISLDFYVNASNNSYPPAPPASDLYVSGNVGIGIPSLVAPTATLEVNGVVAAGSLENQNNPYDSSRVCADAVGKIVSCPVGGAGFSGPSTANYVSPSPSPVKFTVPDGVFKLSVTFGVTWEQHIVYVRPGNVIKIYYNTGSNPPSTSTTSFGTYFSSYGSNSVVVYY